MAVAVSSEVREAGLSQHLRKGMLQDSGQELLDVSTGVKERRWPINSAGLWHIEILNAGESILEHFDCYFFFLLLCLWLYIQWDM